MEASMVVDEVESLEDIRRLLVGAPGPDLDAGEQADRREAQLTKPPGSLGRLEDLARWLSLWQGRHPPTMDRPAARLFAGNHGVARQGVSAFPAAVTAQMVSNFLAGGAAINQLCRALSVSFSADAIELDRPTADFTEAAAMTEAEFLAAFNRGMVSVDRTMDVLALGEMGIGNTTAAAALACGLFGGAAADWTGPGTGLVGAELAHKTKVVERAVARHRDAAGDPLELMRRLGGRELAAIAGAVTAARLLRVPVVLDGFICTAAAAPLGLVDPGALDHCQAGHVSAEPGHRRLLSVLNKEPLLNLGLRLGEGSGAVLAIAVLRAAVACHTGMATFAEAGVATP
ncbi:MAG: nicotinate-nucleotide--dimethylbenzimidazole phosphoribosyltransferase [Rhodospirillales bacterium]|nr:MAG: nicotinate-nucleotide--dimethylbenzimidazole phosphoribosyltransferase [Rhodospirillales bacterium]